ncbi:MAG: hypothetical protein HY794_12910 [Desulfarculus sp.]|nr:hypothetical protein [Desulfarculus sp.]
MYDPLDQRHRAYELLGVGPEADRRQVDAAYNRALKKKGADRKELGQAWRLLRKPINRLEEDLWAYQLGQPPQVGQASQAETAVQLQALLLQEMLQVNLGMTDLASGLYGRDFTRINPRVVALSQSRRYAGGPEAWLPLDFDL